MASTPALWAGSHAERDSQGNVILKGSNCSQLEKEIEAIYDWTTRIGEGKGEPFKYKCDYLWLGPMEWGHHVNITEVIPKLVQEKIGVRPEVNGPNCWNSALVMSKVAPFLRFSSETEFSFWLSSPLCRARRADEPKYPGDIIAIRSKAAMTPSNPTGEEHGFIHLTPTLSFTKNGFSNTNPYALTPRADVYKVYGLNEVQCQNVAGVPKDCKRWSNLMTCMSMDAYLKSNPIKTESLKLAMDQITALECQASGLAFQKTADKNLRNLTRVGLIAIYKLAEKERGEKTWSAHEAFLWDTVVLKVRSLLTQVNQVKE